MSNNSGAAVSLVMTTRVLPGFLLGTVGGVIIDRFDRRKVMVLCDIGRAGLLLMLPFVDNLLGLALVSPVTLVALFTYARAGEVDWQLGIPLAIGGIAAIPAGVAAAYRLPERRLRLAFCGLLFVTAVLLALHG